jgi:hypothetical protein
MSPELRALSKARDEQDAAGRHEGVAAAAHPRGMGFRVLSRMARSSADEETDYAPRHRLDGVDDVNEESSHAD